MGHEVRYATPEGRFTLPLPTYPEIRLALFPRRSLERMIDEFKPVAIHIATEGHDRAFGARNLREARACLHHLVPHALSRICARAHSLHPGRARCIAFLRWFHGRPPR